jgi:hypothetical protein
MPLVAPVSISLDGARAMVVCPGNDQTWRHGASPKILGRLDPSDPMKQATPKPNPIGAREQPIHHAEVVGGRRHRQITPCSSTDTEAH